MNNTPIGRQVGTFTTFCIVLVSEVAVFLLAAALHAGLFGVPALFAAMIVEGPGIACLVSAYAVFTCRLSAQKTAILVQLLILGGVLPGVFAISRNPGLRTPLNLGLHAIMLALIVIGLSLLAIPRTRSSLHGDQAVRLGTG